MSEVEQRDIDYMAMALKEASRGRYTTSPNPSVGCVFVRDGQVIGSGYHHKAGEPHAEIMAMQDAKHDVKDSTCYVTLEPCSHYGRTPPCAKALCEAGVKRVVIGIADPNPKVSGRGVRMLQQAGIEVEVGLLNQRSFEMNRAFFKSISTNTPFVLLKYGMSLDGKIALSNGESKWITNEASRADVQRLRLWADAMITSINTVRSDNARLNVRYEQLPEKNRLHLQPDMLTQPIKVVLDSHGSLTNQELEKFEIFQSGLTYVVQGTNAPIVEIRQEGEKKLVTSCDFKITKTLKDGVQQVIVPFHKDSDGAKHVSLKAVLEFLNSLQVRVAMVEAGARLGAAFLKQDLVDELHCYIAPTILGQQAQSAFALPEPKQLAEAMNFKCTLVRMLDDNIHVVLQSPRIEALAQQLCARTSFNDED